MRSVLVVAAVLIGCGGEGGSSDGGLAALPAYSGPWKWTCSLSLLCRPQGIDPYYLTKFGGSYCTAYPSEATSQANAQCASAKTSTCNSCSASCSRGGACP